MHRKAQALEELKSFTARELLEMQLRPPEYLVEGVLPEGTSLLVAKPKVGKTLLAQNVAVAMSSGSPAFGSASVKHAPVLFLALEGSTQGLQDRIDGMLDGRAGPDDLIFVREFPRLLPDGIRRLREHVRRNPRTGLIVIDTFAGIRNPTRSSSGMYNADYDALKPLSRLYQDTGVSVLIIHHANKLDLDEHDVIDLVSGTTGLTGAVDNVLVMQPRVSMPNKPSVTLHVIAREMERTVLQFDFEPSNYTWALQGPPTPRAKTPERQALLDAIAHATQPQGPAELATAIRATPGSVRRLVRKMEKEGAVVRTAFGKYTLPPTPSNTGNNGNSSH